MFTGIIEMTAEVVGMSKSGTNTTYHIKSELAYELSIDQSVAHDGVCLTVIAIENDTYQVTAIEETLNRTNLNNWQIGTRINLERAMLAHARLDGHIVQGHVDNIGHCTHIEDHDGSWVLRFSIPPTRSHLMVDKGSICINGISLTVVEALRESFSVAIIPYTWSFTNMSDLKIGAAVNLEFDIIGKYVAKITSAYL
jgi:riboflavin synthase